MLVSAVSPLQTPIVSPAQTHASQPRPASAAPPAHLPTQDLARLTSLPKGIPALASVFASEAPLPPIQVEKRGNFTYYRNAFGVQITQLDYPDGKYFNTFTSQGLAIMLRQHDDKRDTLNFTDMNFNIPRPSQMPNVYFHVQGESPSRMSFNERHELVIQLSNGEQLTLDREQGQTPVQGAFSIRFFPAEMGENFNVIYTGPDTSIKSYKSKGDTVKW